MADAKLSITEALALARRYMTKVSEGQIAAADIDKLSDEDLIAFDDELARLLEDAQREAEREVESASQTD